MGGVLGGIGDFLFGGEDIQPAQQVGSATLQTPGQRNLLDILSNLGINASRSGAQILPNQEVVGPSPLQGSIFQQLQSLLSGGDLGQAFDVALSGPTPISPTTVEPFNQKAVEDFYKTSFVEPALRSFEQDIIPNIQEQFISQNALESGGFNRALAKETGNLQKDLGAQLANLVFQTSEANRGRQFLAGESAAERGFQAGESYRNRGLSAADYLARLGLGAGGTQRSITQAQTTGIPLLDSLLAITGQRAVEPIIQGQQVTSTPGLLDYATGGINVLSGLQGLGGVSGIPAILGF